MRALGLFGRGLLILLDFFERVLMLLFGRMRESKFWIFLQALGLFGTMPSQTECREARRLADGRFQSSLIISLCE